MPAKKRRNLFYVLLVPVGVAFVVTAFAYCVMSFQAMSPSTAEGAPSTSHPMFRWLRAHGGAAMLAELAALAALTLAAFVTDWFWDRPTTADSMREPLS
jgi:hypothetical protein